MAVKVANSVILTGSTIVRSKDNDGVIKDSPALQLVDDASDVLVHAVNHGSVYLHVSRLECFVRFVLPLSSRGIGGNRHFIRIDKSHLYHLLITASTHGIPTVVIFALVLGNILRLSLNRPVWFLEGHIHKERLAIGSHFVHHINGLICHIVSIIEVFRYTIGKDSLLVMYQ